MTRNLFLLLLTAGAAGCGSIPLHEDDYMGRLPSSMNADFTLASQFGTDLASSADLSVTGSSEPPNAGKNGATGLVDLTSKGAGSISGKGKFSVRVTTYAAPSRLLVVFYGDVDGPAAKLAESQAQQLFAQKYPGNSLTRFTHFQGMTGQ